MYYGRFYRSATYVLLERINAYLVRWIRRKYRRFKAKRAAVAYLVQVMAANPQGFRHWRWVRSAW